MFPSKTCHERASSSSSSRRQRTPSTRCLTRPFNASLDAPFNTLLDAPLQRDIVAPLQSIITSSFPLQRVNQRAPSTRCSTRPFNATCRTPSMRRYVVVPLQRIVTLLCLFNALFNSPLQCVVRRAPSRRCLTRPFNALFDAPLQRVV
jgi:hypothetical protein